MIASNQDPVLLLLREACSRRVFPGAMVCASRNGAVRYDHAIGAATLFPIPLPLVSQAIFDVASLTKPVATTAAIMLLVDSGELELDVPISDYIPAMREAKYPQMTIRHLLAHASGLPAHICFYEELEEERQKGTAPPIGTESVDWVIERIAALEDCVPPETQTVYSDLGFILLGRMIEHIAEQPLEVFCREQIFLPLGMEDTFFLPLYDEDARKKMLKGRQIVVTEQCPWRGRLLSGEVHDDNCYSMGGVAGHAGLFSTASDLHRFGYTLLQCSKGVSSFFSPAVIQEFWRIQDCVPHSTRTLGWDTRSPENSQAGAFFSMNTVGHLGFTGCSLWIDRDEDIVAVLLTNRVHPQRDNAAIKEFRPLLHDTLHTLLTRPAPLRPPSKDNEESEGEQTEQSDEQSVVSTENKPVLYPPPQPAPFQRHLTPVPTAEEQQDARPEDEFATSLDASHRIPPHVTPAPEGLQFDDEESNIPES